jgi:hypothetical protein
VTAVHGLDDAADAFADSASGEHLKVLIAGRPPTVGGNEIPG